MTEPQPHPPAAPTLSYAVPQAYAASPALTVVTLLLKAASAFLGIVLLSAGFDCLCFCVLRAIRVRDELATPFADGLAMCIAGLLFGVMFFRLNSRQ